MYVYMYVYCQHEYFTLNSSFFSPEVLYTLDFSLQELVGEIYEPLCSLTCFYVQFHMIL